MTREEVTPVSDSFEELDRAYGAGTVRDPYPTFEKWCRESPVQRMTPHEMFGLPLRIQPPEDAPPVYTALSHDAVSEVLRDARRFSSAAYGKSISLVMGRTILEMDEPEHGRFRALLQKGFTRKGLERWERDVIAPVVEEHIDRFAGRGHADLRRELTFPFPVAVIAAMLGLPREDLEEFHRLAVELISIGFDFERGIRASKALEAYFSRILAERRSDPRDDLISVLALAEIDGERLDDDHIISFLRLLLPAGAETTFRSLSNLIFALLTHTDQLEAVRADRSLIDAAIEEGVRWEPPLTGIVRVATCDTEVQGVPIPEGAMLSVCVAAANHDADRYENPHAFDIFRPPRQSMAFGFGAHRCLGMHLARSESRIALAALLDRLPDLRLDPAAEDVHVTGLVFRSPTQLPVLFEPA